MSRFVPLRSGRFFLPEGQLFISMEKKHGRWRLTGPLSIVHDEPRELMDQEARRFAALLRTRDYPVPLPKTTPYDSDPQARLVYLDRYQRAYRQGMAGYETTLCGERWKYMQAEQDGWSDGGVQMSKDHPEMLVPPDQRAEYLRQLRQPSH